ncbi:MAG: PsbP-related protein [Candidatus Moraniibacteriota bacterium]
MNINKGNVGVIAIVAVGIAIVGSVAVYFVMSGRNQVTDIVQQVAQSTEQPSKTDTVSDAKDTGVQKKYVNDHYRFALSYPTDFGYQDMEHSPELQKTEIMTDTSVGHTVFTASFSPANAADGVVNDAVDITIQKHENRNNTPFTISPFSSDPPLKLDETTVGGVYAVHYVLGQSVSTEQGTIQVVNEAYVVENDGYVYTIESNGTDPVARSALKGIIDSFRFTGAETASLKLYENAKYGFSLDLPPTYWYDEVSDPGAPAAMEFTLVVEDPRLRIITPIISKDNSIRLPKYGQLFSVIVRDISRINPNDPIIGLNDTESKLKSSATIGGVVGSRYSDCAYIVRNGKYEYEFLLESGDNSGATHTPEMKQAFEDIVKTVRFK